MSQSCCVFTVVSVIYFLYFLHESKGQNNSSSALTSSALNGALATENGRVIVSDDNTVYLLNGDLTEVTRRVRNEGKSPEGMTLTSDESRLIVCWANAMTFSGELVNTAPCTVYNASTLEVLINIARPSTGVGAPRGNSYSVSRGSSGAEETFYVMSSFFNGDYRFCYHREYSVNDGSMKREETPSIGHIISRRYFNGLNVNSRYSYVVVADEDNNKINRVRVIRVCDGKTAWDSWYEIQLICGSVEGSVANFNSTLLAANFLTVEDGVSEAMLVITVESDTGSFDTCSFPLSDIDSRCTSLLSFCKNDNRNSLPFPWNNGGSVSCYGAHLFSTECHMHVATLSNQYLGPTRLSSQVGSNFPQEIQPLYGKGLLMSLSSSVLSSAKVFIVDRDVVMYAGLPTGEVRKYSLQFQVLHSLANDVDPTPECIWSLSSSVKSLTYSRGSDYVYAVTDTTVYRLPVKDCSGFSGCSSCAKNGGSLCGWCSVENKCSFKAECANSTSSLRWVQDSGTCLSVSIASAESISGNVKSYPRDQMAIGVTITNLPPVLSGESFQCVFGDLGSGELTPLRGNMYSCRVPNIPSFTGEDKQTVNFAMRSTLLNIDFGLVVDGVTFYDCSVRDNCSSCVASLNCNWCPVEFGCRTRGDDCSASPVNKSQSCPRVLPSSTTDGRYYLHEGLSSPDVSLVLNAQNLISPTGGYSYVCELSETGRTFSAVVTSSTVTCNVSAVSISQAERESPVRLLWMKNNASDSTNFIIESSTGNDQKVVLYSCSRLAVDCSTCIGLNDTFNCAYCTSTDSGSCMLSTLTCHSPGLLVKPPFLDQCSSPAVLGTSPPAGPVKGGTLYTIRGSNLGTYPRENVTILFGERVCPINSSVTDGNYNTFSCIVPAATLEGEANVTLVRGDGDRHVMGRYRYAVPRIDKVMPGRSPTRGGSTVYVMGVNLDIGNVERTSVGISLNSTASGQSTIWMANVTVINSTHISCTTVDVSRHVSGSDRGVLTLNIDGYSYSNENIHLDFVQPKFDGIFESIKTTKEQTLLQGGGVPLVVLGTYLDAAESPKLELGTTSAQLALVNCTVLSSRKLSCVIPVLERVPVGTSFQYSLRFDNDILSNLSSLQSLTAVADPVFVGVQPTQYQETSNHTFAVLGDNVGNVREDDYAITIGGEPCTSVAVNVSRVLCRPPQNKPSGKDPYPVIVTIGIRSGIQVGTLHYYTTTSTPDLLPLYVSTAVTLACIIICLTITTITCVYRYRKKKAKAEDEASDLRNLVDREREANEELEQQVENMESQVFMVHSQMKDLVQGRGSNHTAIVHHEYDYAEEPEEGIMNDCVPPHNTIILDSERKTDNLCMGGSNGKKEIGKQARETNKEECIQHRPVTLREELATQANQQSPTDGLPGTSVTSKADGIQESHSGNYISHLCHLLEDQPENGVKNKPAKHTLNNPSQMPNCSEPIYFDQILATHSSSSTKKTTRPASISSPDVPIVKNPAYHLLTPASDNNHHLCKSLLAGAGCRSCEELRDQ